jgi:hypothetical protein
VECKAGARPRKWFRATAPKPRRPEDLWQILRHAANTHIGAALPNHHEWPIHVDLPQHVWLTDFLTQFVSIHALRRGRTFWSLAKDRVRARTSFAAGLRGVSGQVSPSAAVGDLSRIFATIPRQKIWRCQSTGYNSIRTRLAALFSSIIL